MKVSDEGLIHAVLMSRTAGRILNFCSYYQNYMFISEIHFLCVFMFLYLPVLHSQNNGPLRIDKTNPRYFTDNSGKAILLAGSHTWANFQEIEYASEKEFDFQGYLNLLKANHHNFIRFWTWEQSRYAPWTKRDVRFSPLPYARAAGSGLAQDGEAKFDLTKWNEAYFTRLRERVIKYKEAGVFTSIMLFQGFSLNKSKTDEVGDPWQGHPYNGKNNINRIDLSYTGIDDDEHPSLHSLKNKAIVKLQEAYVMKVIDAINDQDNVLYEIINEGGATDWQYHMVDFIHQYEKTKPKQHPVGITSRIDPRVLNEDLVKCNADWISPGGDWVLDYKANPPVNDGRKVQVADTDHFWGHGGNYQWVWKSVLRGYNLLFMDPWTPLDEEGLDKKVASVIFTGEISRDDPNYPDWDLLRRNMGYARMMMDTLHLETLVPKDSYSSTHYCLTNDSSEYVVYFPEGNAGMVNMNNATGAFSATWFFPILNRSLVQPPVKGGDYNWFTVPFTGDAVLVLKRIK